MPISVLCYPIKVIEVDILAIMHACYNAKCYALYHGRIHADVSNSNSISIKIQIQIMSLFLK